MQALVENYQLCKKLLSKMILQSLKFHHCQALVDSEIQQTKIKGLLKHNQKLHSLKASKVSKLVAVHKALHLKAPTFLARSIQILAFFNLRQSQLVLY